MKFKTIVLLAVAIGCGLVAMLGVQQVLSKDGPVAEKRARVLVATADIVPGEPLSEANTRFRDWPADSVPEGAVTTPEQFQERALLFRAVPGEVVMQAKLGEKGVYGPAAEIPDGMQVVTVSVDLTMTQSGMIRPGDRVDVLVTYQTRHPELGQMKKTKRILQFVKVFATDNVRDSGGAEVAELKAKNISMIVKPSQAMLLKHAESKGELHLTLRSRTDDDQVEDQAISDLQFEDMSGGSGIKDEQLEHQLYDDLVNQEQQPQTEETASVREFLEGQTAETTPEVSAEPATPKWTIRIYAGAVQRVEEVDDPQAAEPAATDGSDA